MSKFYTFIQNNSDGHFHHDPKEGIGARVIIEAQNAAHAIDRAERIGLYFNGCQDGRDCSCCGDRWSGYLGYPDDSDGTDEPEIYGEKYAPCEAGDKPYIYFGLPSYVHYIGGEFKAIKESAK